MVARYGQINELHIDLIQESGETMSLDVSQLIGKQIHRIDDWGEAIAAVEGESNVAGRSSAARWLEKMLPRP